MNFLPGGAATGSGVVETVVDAFAVGGVDLARLGLAWARAAPAVAIVPAFGLRALPAGARAIVGLALAAAIFPAVGPANVDVAGRWAWLALEQVVAGLPVAVAAAVPLWAATMAGGVADALRSSNETIDAPTVEGSAPPLGVLLSIFASSLFLATGGPARVATALATHPSTSRPLLAAAADISSGITLAVAIGGPLLAAAVVVEVTGALIARSASPAQIHLLLAPLRALALLAVMALVFDRLAAVLAVAVRS